MIAAAALMLAGCTVGPDFRKPSVATEPSFESAVKPVAPAGASLTAGSPEERWWRTLNDPTLDELIGRVVASNLDYRIAQLRVREARAELAYANGGLYPDLNGSASYSRQRLSKTAAPFNAFDVPGFPWEFNQYQAGFDASWEIDVFGGIRRGIEAARADADAQTAISHGVLLSVIAELARNYVELRGAQRRYAIAEQTLRAQRETLELTRDRRKQGLVTELDVSQAASEVARTEANLPLLRRAQLQSIHRLSVLLGQPPESLDQQLSTERAIPVPPPQVAIGVPAELLRRRPDIQRAERELAAATARTGEAAADLLPKLSISGSFAWTSSTTGNLFSFPSRSFAFGPAVTVPLFNAGRLRAKLDVRDAQQEQALVRYQQTVLGALEETHDAIVAYLTEQQRHGSLREAVKQDQAAVELAQGQYRQGLVDFLNVLETQRSLYQSQDALAQSDRALTTSLIALYKALGGGWQLAPDVAQASSLPSPKNTAAPR